MTTDKDCRRGLGLFTTITMKINMVFYILCQGGKKKNKKSTAVRKTRKRLALKT